MRAARMTGPGRFEIVARDELAPDAGKVLIRVGGCGVCASDLGPWHGVGGVTHPLAPGAPGHEVYGRVAAVGDGVEGLRPGDPVTAITYHGYAEYDVAPAGAVVPLPPSLADLPVPGEPVGCAVNVARRAGVREGDHVVVLGIGFLGALLLRLLRRHEPARLTALSRRPTALRLAERFGADDVIGLDEDVAGLVAAATGGRMADVVIEATGRSGPLALAAELTRVRGRLVIAGYHQDGPRTVNLQLWNWRGLDVVNAHERDPAIYRDGMEEGVRLLAGGALELAPLLSHVFPLADINRAFLAAEERPDGFVKALVEAAP